MDFRPKFGMVVDGCSELVLVTKTRMPAGYSKIFSCVRPVVFNDPASPFSALPGTGFLIEDFGNYYFVTARHVLKSFNLQHLAIPYSSTDPFPLPWKAVRVCAPTDLDDTDHSDLAIFLLDRERLDATRFGDERPFRLWPNDFVTDFSPGMQLGFRGLSPERSLHDYEENKFRFNFITREANYVGLDSASGVHQMRFLLMSETMPSLDGHSGGPVFLVENRDSPAATALFAGMLIRGSAKSAIVRFLSAACIVDALTEMGFRYGFDAIDRLKVKD